MSKVRKDCKKNVATSGKEKKLLLLIYKILNIKRETYN